MDVPGFTVWDYLVLIGFLVLSTLIGLYFAWKDRKEKDNQNFLTANKQLGWIPVSLSMAASFLSAIAILGLPAEVYQHGSILWWGAVSSSIAILSAMYIFMPMFYKMNVSSINEYLEKRFRSKPVRQLGSAAFMIQTLLYLGVVLYGPSLALGSVTGLPVWASILLNGLVCTFYTSIGGIKAVVWTDAVQMLLIYVGYIMVIWSGLSYLGGWCSMWSIAEDGGRAIFAKWSFSLYDTYTTWNLVLAWTVFWLTAYCASQTQFQRYVSMASMKDAQKALAWNIPAVGITVLLSVVSGLVIYAVYGKCDPRIRGQIDRADQLMPYIVQDLLRDYPGCSGLLVTSVFSGSLSTLSSGYNALAAVTWDDFVKPRVSWSGRQALVFTKLAAATFGLISVAVAFLAGSMNSIIQASASLNGAMNGPLFALFFVGAFLPMVKEKGALVGTITGMIISCWLALGSISYSRLGDALLTSTANCSSHVYTSSMVHTMGSSQGSAEVPEGMLAFYHISYIWTAFVGFLVSVVVSLAGSVFLDAGDKRKVHPDFVAPFVRKWISGYENNNNTNGKAKDINATDVTKYESSL